MKFQNEDNRLYALTVVCVTFVLSVGIAGLTVYECLKLTHPPAVTTGK